MLRRYNPNIKYNLELGTIRNTNKPYHYEMRGFGNLLFLAKPRTGKTSIVKTLIAETNKIGRKQVIFDRFNDYIKIDIPNFDCNHKRYSVRGLRVVSDFAFKISDFTSLDFLTFDPAWPALGLKTVMGLVKRKDVHSDDFHTMMGLLTSLPQKDEQVEEFNEKFGFSDTDDESGYVYKPFSYATVDSVCSRFNNMRRLFYEEGKGRIAIENIEKLVSSSDVLVFNFYGMSEQEYQVYAGIILRKLLPLLGRYNMSFIFEEADKIAPAEPQGPIASLLFLDDYVCKYQRTNSHYTFISQNANKLWHALVENHSWLIVGKLNEGSKYFEDTKGLYLDRDLNIRDFMSIDPDKNWRIIFNPFFVPCQ